MLDSVRAAQHVPAAAASRRFVAWGHSQGGHAVLFVGQIAASYAPDLSLLGVAAVSPPTDLETLLQENLPDGTGRILASYAVWSWSHVYDYELAGAVRKRAIPIPQVPGSRQRTRDGSPICRFFSTLMSYSGIPPFSAD